MKTFALVNPRFGLAFLVALSTFTALAKTYYVSPNGTAEFGNSTYDNPTSLKSMSTGLDSLYLDGAEVVFKQGVYDMTDATYGGGQFPLRSKNVKFRGETGDPKDVVLDGGNAKRGFFSNAGWGEGAGSGTVIRDLTMRNMYIADPTWGAAYAGVAVYLQYGGLISNCVFTACTQDKKDYDAVVNLGAYNNNQSEIVDCVFDNSTAEVGTHLMRTSCSGGNIIVRGCTFIQNGKSRGILSNYGSTDWTLAKTTKIYDSTFTNCFSYWGANAGHIGYVSNCTFTANSATGAGGALYIEAPSAQIYDSRFYGNWLTGKGTQCHGGAIAGPMNNTGVGAYYNVMWTNAVLSGCTFVGNASTNGYGGAVRARFGRVERCAFTNNVALYCGGALHLERTKDGVADLVDSSFVCNTNKNNNNRTCGGSAVYSSISLLRMENDEFLDNWANGSGAVMSSVTMKTSAGEEHLNTSGDFAISNCVFRNNFAYYYGGALWGACTHGIVDSVFEGNTTKGSHNDGNYTARSGAIEVLSKPGTTNWFKRCEFVGNKSGGKSGGAVNAYSGALAFERCSFVSNRVERYPGCSFSEHGGGAISMVTGAFGGNKNLLGLDALVDSCFFEGNSTSLGYGGAIYFDSTGAAMVNRIIRNSLFVGNVVEGANKYGGGVSIATNTHVTCCTFVGNKSKQSNGGGLDNGGASNWASWGTVKNCLFWKNEGVASDARNVTAYGQTISAISYCAEDGASGKISTDVAYHNLYLGDSAGFVDEAKGDYRIARGSALVDKGFNEPWMAGVLDLSGDRRSFRIINGIVDIGCYEYTPNVGLMLLFR